MPWSFFQSSFLCYLLFSFSSPPLSLLHGDSDTADESHNDLLLSVSEKFAFSTLTHRHKCTVAHNAVTSNRRRFGSAVSELRE